MKTILVTGGGGFIGSHLAERLAQQGNNVLIIDNFNSYYDPSLKRRNIRTVQNAGSITVIEASITDVERVNRLFEEHRIDMVYHLAAQAGVRASIENPRIYFEVNVLGTLTLLDAIRNNGNPPLVFSSTSSIYGDNTKVPFHEEDSVRNQLSPYAVSKRSAELLCRNYHRLYNMNIWCLRLFTVYGPRQRPDMAISKFLAAARNGSTISVYGDGTMRREYTFVSDVIDSMVQAVDRVNGYEIINVGGAETYTINQLLETIESVTGKTIDKTYTEIPKGDVPVTQADTEKARRLLGYDPVIGLEEGIARQWEWSNTVD